MLPKPLLIQPAKPSICGSKVCLNMIVKNESSVIARVLTSVKDVIDYFVIVDTGPNDGRLVLAGDSAGGNLVVCTCLALDAATRKHILGQVLIYPATDHYSAGFGSYVEKARGQLLTAAIVTWFWDTYLAGLPPDAPAAQRAFPRRSPDTGTLPPTLLVTAENDPLRDEGKAYAGQLGEAGVQVRFHHFDNAAHGFACGEGRSNHFQLFISQLTSWLSGLDKPIEERQL